MSLEVENRAAEWKAFNVALCEALELDPRTVRRVTITARAGQAAVVEVETLAQPGGTGSRLVELVKRYELTPRR